MDWRDIPSLAALRAFEAAARTGSLTKAASELNVTHAAIAQHVRTVEDTVGAPLLTRAGRGMALTDKGAQLAAPLSDSIAQIIAAVRQVSNEAQNAPLAVTVTPSFAENWLMPRLGAFWAMHPEITLSVTPSNAIVDLRRDGYDMAIRYGMGKWPGLDASFLVSGDFIVVAAPSLLGDRKACTVADLQDFPWLFETVHQVHRRWAEENGLDLRCCQINEFATLSMVMSALRAGVGVSVVSRALVADDLAKGTLIAVQEVPRAGLGYYIVTRPGVHSAKLKTFTKWLKSA